MGGGNWLNPSAVAVGPSVVLFKASSEDTSALRVVCDGTFFPSLLKEMSDHQLLTRGFSFMLFQEVPDFTSKFISKDISECKPLKGLRVGVIPETLDEGVDAEVVSSIRSVVSHLEELGCTMAEVSLPSLSLGLLAYYILASYESSSNLSRYDDMEINLFLKS